MNTQKSSGLPQVGMGAISLKGWEDYLIIIRGRWIIALTAAMILSSLFCYYQLQKPEVFASTAYLIAEPSADQVVNITEVVNMNDMSEAILQVHESQLRSSMFRQTVINSFSKEERALIAKPYLKDLADSTGADDEAALEQKIETAVQRAIGAGLAITRFERKSQFSIGMRHQNAKVAANVANRFVEQYQKYLLDRSQKSNQKAIDFLTKEAGSTEDSMDQTWKALSKWREEENLISIKEQQDFIQDKRKQIGSSLTAMNHNRLISTSKIQLLKEQLESGKDPFQNPDILAFGSLSALKETRDNLLEKGNLLNRKYLKRHPLVVDNLNALKSLDERIQRNIESALRKLENELVEINTNEVKLEEELVELDEQLKSLNVLSITADRLKFALEADQQTLKTVKERRREIEITSRMENLNIKIADRAYPSGRAIEPNVQKSIIISILMACLIFVGIPIGLDAMDNKVNNSWDITQFLKVDILAQVGTLSKVPKTDRMNIARKGLDHAAVESFRDLYSQIGTHSKVDFPKTILITSTIPEEGKSMLACNMASVFGRHGHKTLLIDVDLRRPTLHRIFNHKNSRGLIRFLKNQDSFPGPITKDPALGIFEMEPNVHLMCSGGHSRDATEIIVNVEFRALLKALHEEYSLIILDTPPLGVFPDALLLADMSDELLYLIRHGKPKRTAVKNLMQKLQGTQVDLLGVIVNDLPPKKSSYYYGYHGYYSYYTYKNYQKYYGSSEKNKK